MQGACCHILAATQEASFELFRQLDLSFLQYLFAAISIFLVCVTCSALLI